MFSEQRRNIARGELEPAVITADRLSVCARLPQTSYRYSSSLTIPIYFLYIMWNRWYLRCRVSNSFFCKRHSPEGPTEKDAILRDFHTAALSEVEEVPEVQDFQNQVEILTSCFNTKFIFTMRQQVALLYNNYL